MADKQSFGFCQNCQYWMVQGDGERKPCTRINTQQGEIDVELEGSDIPPDQQRFSVPATFGCSLFEAIGDSDQGENEQDQNSPLSAPQQPLSNAPQPQNPKTLDDFLS